MTAARTVEELSEVSIALDRLTDELHTIVEQLGQLKSLRDVHSASALAMALRKVNSTFLKQVAESQKLREQIDSMEAERDEAWKQAEDVAQDFDNLSDQVLESRGEPVEGMSALRSSSRRSARVSAVRKSSIRQSKAGLRSVSKCRSQRSSVSSSGTRTSLMMSMSATSDDIPPVPPLPLHTPLGIVTSNLSGRNSLGKFHSHSQFCISQNLFLQGPLQTHHFLVLEPWRKLRKSCTRCWVCLFKRLLASHLPGHALCLGCLVRGMCRLARDRCRT
jgi:hypothetical protein